MQLYGLVLLIAIITALYTLKVAWEIGKNKNWLGACFVAALALSIVVIPLVTNKLL